MKVDLMDDCWDDEMDDQMALKWAAQMAGLQYSKKKMKNI